MALAMLRRNIHENVLGRASKRLRFALDVVLREQEPGHPSSWDGTGETVALSAPAILLA
jgi:hypothetical protein